ncbi:ESPR-type extended signal peptide-containing protein, partial [Vitreoscilla stercoraria]
MNKIYKVIWNESLETYVAVAEIENSHSSSSRRTRVRALLNTIVFTPVMSVMAVAVVGTLTTPQQAHAAYAADGGVNNGGTVAIGAGAVADGTRSIALGGDAKTKGTHTVKVKGVDKVYTTPDGNNQAIAIGYESYAYGSQAVGLGANVRAVGNSSIAIGGDDLNAAAGTSNNSDTAKAYKDITGDNLVRAYDGKTGATNQYFGTSAGHAAVAIGVQAGSMGDLSTAFGTRTQADGLAATALGVGATANKDGSIALGAGSQTSTDAVKVTQAEIGGILFDNFTGTNAFAGTIYDTGRQVSIGSAGKERQIKHVAPGQLTQTSTDAINGSQLYAVAMKLSNVKDTAEKGWYVNSVFAGGALTATGPEKMSPGDTLTFSVGENLELDQIRGTIALRVAKNVQFDSVTTGDSVLNSTGLNIASSKGNTVSITNDGINLGNQVINGVSEGLVSGQSKQAVNGSQLYAANQNIANSLGGNAGVDATTGALTAPNYQVTNAAGDAVVYTDAAGNTLATAAGNVGDALTQMNTYVNTGFDVQQAGTTKGTVTPGDKINFVNGTLTTAKVTTEANGVTD